MRNFQASTDASLLKRALAFTLVLPLILAGCSSASRRPAKPPPPGAGAAAAATDLMLPVRYDATTGKLFLTIRRPSEEMLYLNPLAAGLGALGLDRGQVG